MNIISKYESEKTFEKAKAFCAEGIIDKSLATEHRMKILVNEKPVFEVVCTPDDLEYLALGRLKSEGIIENAFDIETLYLCESGATVKVFLKENIEFDGELSPILSVSTCCTDNKSFIKDKKMRILTHLSFSREDVLRLTGAFETHLPLYDETHAVHSALLMRNGEIIFSSEDIGRHNAVDKVIGKAMAEDITLEECILFSSGRLPVDMVRKAIFSGVPVLVGKGAPTIDSVKLANEYGLKLIANARKNDYIEYT